MIGTSSSGMTVLLPSLISQMEINELLTLTLKKDVVMVIVIAL